MEAEIIRRVHNQSPFSTQKSQDIIEKWCFIPKLITYVSKVIIFSNLDKVREVRMFIFSN